MRGDSGVGSRPWGPSCWPLSPLAQGAPRAATVTRSAGSPRIPKACPGLRLSRSPSRPGDIPLLASQRSKHAPMVQGAKPPKATVQATGVLGRSCLSTEHPLRFRDLRPRPSFPVCGTDLSPHCAARSRPSPPPRSR